MATFTIRPKLKQSAKEKREIAVAKAFLKTITVGWAKQTCKEYMPGCPACDHWILVGMVQDYISTQEYGAV